MHYWNSKTLNKRMIFIATLLVLVVVAICGIAVVAKVLKSISYRSSYPSVVRKLVCSHPNDLVLSNHRNGIFKFRWFYTISAERWYFHRFRYWELNAVQTDACSRLRWFTMVNWYRLRFVVEFNLTNIKRFDQSLSLKRTREFDLLVMTKPTLFPSLHYPSPSKFLS